MKRAALAAFLCCSSVAHADLRSDAALVASEWQRLGATVRRLPSRFLHEEGTLTVVVAGGQEPGGECMSVAVLGPRGVSFRAKVDGGDDDDPGARLQSVAGALLVIRCGATAPRKIVVSSDSGRGALEVVVGRFREPLPALRAVLPERIGGVLTAGPEPGELPPLSPPDKRADLAVARATREGGRLVQRTSLVAHGEGNGSSRIALAPGCHRLQLFARDPKALNAAARGRLDVDGELRDEADDRVLARDRSDAPDVRIEACVGEATRGIVAFLGAPSETPVVLVHSVWALPQHLPAMWGTEPLARLAQALRKRNVASPAAPAVFRAQGVSGLTPVAVAVEPGACYLAVAAIVQGSPRGIGLRATLGAWESSDERGVGDHAGVVAFCAHDRHSVELTVDARGSGVGWGLALFRTVGGAWEVPR